MNQKEKLIEAYCNLLLEEKTSSQIEIIDTTYEDYKNKLLKELPEIEQDDSLSGKIKQYNRRWLAGKSKEYKQQDGSIKTVETLINYMEPVSGSFMNDYSMDIIAQLFTTYIDKDGDKREHGEPISHMWVSIKDTSESQLQSSRTTINEFIQSVKIKLDELESDSIETNN